MNLKYSRLGIYLLFILCMISCSKTKEAMKLHQGAFSAPPSATIRPEIFTEFGNERVDPYYWLKNKEYQEVIDYLKAENAYSEEVMSSTKGLQKQLYKEIFGRIKDADESCPLFDNGYYYYSRTESGKQYRLYCRKKGSLEAAEELLFDANKMAEGCSAFVWGGFQISPNNRYAAYFYNETGSYAEFSLKFKDLQTGKEIGFSVEGAGSVAWANDNSTLFYSMIDETLRSDRIYRRGLHDPEGVLIYQEKDSRFDVQVEDEKTRQFILISSSSSTTSEERFVSADSPYESFKLFKPRKKEVEYEVYPHKECFFVRYKDKQHLNGMIYRVPLDTYDDEKSWQVMIPHRDDALLEEVDLLKDYFIVCKRINGLNEIRLYSLKSGASRTIAFPESIYAVNLSGNPEYDATTFRYSYSSLNRPNTIYEYDITTEKTTALKVQEIPSGFNPEEYEVERIWAEAADGEKIPMGLVYRKGMQRDGTNPTLLYSYGSYGSSSDLYFRSSYFSLIDRGFVVAVAQIRGGSDLGEQWYEDGKLLQKKNSFTDFIACAETLIGEGYTRADKLAAMGGSAGGLLMGAVSNMRPELFQAIVAQVPFVDVVTTMLDESLPLTTGEYEEWGDPHEEEYYRYMLSYSPYDNVTQQDYPHMLITGGLNDSQVLFHEPAKWTAKLRATKSDDRLLLLHMDMDSGHGGATGRYDQIKDIAFEWAFLIRMLGVE